MQTLAIKYRPKTFEDVVEQNSIKTILQQQLNTNETKNAYLFCGGAGTGKTTCARIFANEINGHQGSPIEIDAASNSGVDDVREIVKQSVMQSLDSPYKIYIIDECHSLSNTAWQAFLKLIEEPPAKTIFIFCTTDPQKIPRTILSRVQRFDFQRISNIGVKMRLLHIITAENCCTITNREQQDALVESIEYIAKVADGGMRDAITLLDKCLSYSNELTVENVVNALGTADYTTMIDLINALNTRSTTKILDTINKVHYDGKDLKQFIKSMVDFTLNLVIFSKTNHIELTNIPSIYKDDLEPNRNYIPMLDMFLALDDKIHWESSPKTTIIATLLLEVSKW